MFSFRKYIVTKLQCTKYLTTICTSKYLTTICTTIFVIIQ